MIIYKELDKEFPDQHASSLARTYTTYGRLLAKWKGRRADALEAYKKALEINVTLEHDYPGVYTKEIEMIKKYADSMTIEDIFTDLDILQKSNERLARVSAKRVEIEM